MTCPSRILLAALVAVLLLLVGVLIDPLLLAVAVVADVWLIGMCVWEGRALRRLPVSVERCWQGRLQINRPAELVCAISNRSSRQLHVMLRQPWPQALAATTNRVTLVIGPGRQALVSFTVTPVHRGRIECQPMEVDLGYKWGLSRRRWSVSEGGKLTIYPDLQALVEYEQLRRSRALKQVGIHRVRTVGAGREFEQLRDYLPDDDYRDVNWKATARRRKPVTNIYQVERSRDVMLCLDCGRMMGNPVGAGTSLDRAVDAAIMLAHVSNRQDDRTGLALFGDTVELMLRPRTGRGAVHAVINRLVDLTPKPVFPSFANLAEALRARQNHRTLVFIFTDLNDPQIAADLSQVMPLLSSRHMVVVVSLRDALLDRIADGPAESRQAMFEQIAARQLVTERDSHCRELIKAGVHVLEADANRLTLDVINTYLAIKHRQLL